MNSSDYGMLHQHHQHGSGDHAQWIKDVQCWLEAQEKIIRWLDIIDIHMDVRERALRDHLEWIQAHEDLELHHEDILRLNNREISMAYSVGGEGTACTSPNTPSPWC